MNRSINMVRRCVAMILIVVIAFSLVACGADEDTKENVQDLGLETEQVVTIWYTNSKYMDYLHTVAEELHASNDKLTVKIEFIEDDNYITKIYDSSMKEDNGPDLFIADASELDRLCSMGLVAENNVYNSNYTADNYCDNAIRAATLNDKLYGYPIDFNVAFMAYNTAYAYSIETFKQLGIYIAYFDSNEYNESVQQIVAWDVADMFMNFAFSSDSIKIGGESGDDSTQVEVDEAKLIKAMNEFIKFRDEYGIFTTQSTKLDYKEMFENGNMSYTIMDMQYFSSLVESNVPFNVCEIPTLTSDLKPNSLSETTLALVSPYAKNSELAKLVANALSYEYAHKFTETTGGVSAKKMTYEGEYAEDYQKIYDIYDNSTIKAQFRGSTSMYTYYEILINQIYEGKDITTAVNDFAKELKPRKN